MCQFLNIKDKTVNEGVENIFNKMFVSCDDSKATLISRVLKIIFRLNVVEVVSIEAPIRGCGESGPGFWISLGYSSNNREMPESSNCFMKLCLTDFGTLVSGIETQKWISILIGLLVESCCKFNEGGGLNQLYIDTGSPDPGDEILTFGLTLLNQDSTSKDRIDSRIKAILRVSFPSKADLLRSEFEDQLAKTQKIDIVGDLIYQAPLDFYDQLLMIKKLGAGALRIPLRKIKKLGAHLTLRIGDRNFDVEVAT